MRRSGKISSTLLTAVILTTVLAGCKSCQPTYEFGYQSPEKAMVFDLPFPNDLVYSSTPDAKIIVGKKDARPPLNEPGGMDAPYYEIGGFNVETGEKLWQLPFQGEIVGQTEKQILVYEEPTSTVHFINPADGSVTRKVSPAPNPLASKNGLEYGMAFTDEVYLTTKALYTQIWADTSGKDMTPNWENRKEDETFKIGVTAKTWKGDKMKWYIPAVKQIVTVEYRPAIFGDKVFVINPPQTVDGDQTYQIISLVSGKELFRGKTAGKFSRVGKDLYIEQTENRIRRLDPLSGADIWQIDGEFHNAAIGIIGSQITIAVPQGDTTRKIILLDVPSGDPITEFELPYTVNTPLKGCFQTDDKQIMCNFVAETRTDILHREFDYFVGYDPVEKKVLWRTSLGGQSAGSLFPFAGGKMRLIDVK